MMDVPAIGMRHRMTVLARYGLLFLHLWMMDVPAIGMRHYMTAVARYGLLYLHHYGRQITTAVRDWSACSLSDRRAGM